MVATSGDAVVGSATAGDDIYVLATHGTASLTNGASRSRLAEVGAGIESEPEFLRLSRATIRPGAPGAPPRQAPGVAALAHQPRLHQMQQQQQ